MNRYFCRTCWQWQHSTDAVKYHKPLTRNSKSQTLVGIGPASSTNSLASLNSQPTMKYGGQQQQYLMSMSMSQTQDATTANNQHQHTHQQQQQQQQANMQQQQQQLQTPPQQQQQQQLQQIPTIQNAFHL